MRRDEAIAVWALMAAATAGGRELDEQELAIRAELIADVPAGLGREVALELARARTFLPAVGDYLDAVADRVLGPAPTPADVTAELFEAVRRRGWISPPGEADLSPIAARALAAMGGWMAFCEGEEMVNRAHLVKLAPPLIEAARRQETRRALAELNGPPPAELDA